MLSEFYERKGTRVMKKVLTSSLICLATMLAASSALAVEPSPTAGRGSVGALFGYGFKEGLNLGLACAVATRCP